MSQTNVFSLGDFNLDLLIDYCSDFKDTMHSMGSYSLITRHTRNTMHSSTIIDYIFISPIKDDLVADITIAGISGHLSIFGRCRLGDTNEYKKIISYIKRKSIILHCTYYEKYLPPQ